MERGCFYCQRVEFCGRGCFYCQIGESYGKGLFLLPNGSSLMEGAVSTAKWVESYGRGCFYIGFLLSNCPQVLKLFYE